MSQSRPIWVLCPAFDFLLSFNSKFCPREVHHLSLLAYFCPPWVLLWASFCNLYYSKMAGQKLVKNKPQYFLVFATWSPCSRTRLGQSLDWLKSIICPLLVQAPCFVQKIYISRYFLLGHILDMKTRLCPEYVSRLSNLKKWEVGHGPRPTAHPWHTLHPLNIQD